MHKLVFKNVLPISIVCLGLVLIQTMVYATNECGPAVVGGNITCNGDGTPVNDANSYSNGIRYSTGGLTLGVNANATTILTNNGVGVELINIITSTNPITANLASTLSIETSGVPDHDGVMAKQDGTGAVVITSAASILTRSNDGEGLLGWINNNSNSQTITITNTGQIETQGINASGVYAFTRGTGAINISSNAAITTAGTSSDPILGYIFNTTSNAPITLSPITGNLISTGNFSAGITAYQGGSGNIDISSSANITTSGTSSYGIYANPYAAGNSSAVTINVSGGSITTPDATADGIFSDSAGTGIYSIAVSNTTINAGRFAVHSVGAAGGTINISSTATLNSTTSGVAIRDGDQDGNGVDADEAPPPAPVAPGNIVITTAGTINGDIIMGLGNDTLNFTAGSVTGNIQGDDIAEAANDGDDTVNWSGGTLTGGILTGRGSDAVTISSSGYTGSEILNGGDDSATADGWIDTLTFQNIQATVDGTKISNWEQLVIDNANITLSMATVQGTLVSNINGGKINMQDASPNTTLTFNGNYTGTAGSQILIDSVLADNSTVTDTLTIQGDTSGTTQISINNIGGAGGATTGNGILLITVVGNSNGIFTIASGANRAGNYLYNLVKIGNNWYLQSNYMPLSIPSLNQYGIALLLLLLLLLSVTVRKKYIVRTRK